MTVDRIIFLSDLVRIGGSVQSQHSFNKNIQWFFRLLNKQIAFASRKPVVSLLIDDASKYNASEVYRLLKKEPTIESWAEIFNCRDVPQEIISYFESHLHNSLVVGFELSPFIMEVLVKLNIPTVSLIWHPVRFMDDIFFGFRTNVPEIFSELCNYQLPSSSIYSHAELYRARNLRIGQSLECEGSILLGQTNVDRSLIDESKISSLEMFQDKILSIAGNNHIHFRAHPFLDKVPNFLDKLSDIHNISIMKNSEYCIYDLLCCEKIKNIIALSSSVLYEARYFEKDAYRLIKEIETFAEDSPLFDIDSYIPVYHEFMSVSFWSDILRPVLKTVDYRGITLPFKPNRLRHANCSYWGYEDTAQKQVVEPA